MIGEWRVKTEESACVGGLTSERTGRAWGVAVGSRGFGIDIGF